MAFYERHRIQLGGFIIESKDRIKLVVISCDLELAPCAYGIVPTPCYWRSAKLSLENWIVYCSQNYTVHRFNFSQDFFSLKKLISNVICLYASVLVQVNFYMLILINFLLYYRIVRWFCSDDIAFRIASTWKNSSTVKAQTRNFTSIFFF